MSVLKRFCDLNIGAASYQAAYWGAGNGPPLLLLHGFMGSSICWRSLVSLLPSYRCIALDLLGFGDSSKPMMRYDIAVLVEFVHHFVKCLGGDRPTLVGHSLGGWVAAAYAIAYPEAVNRLVIAAPAGIRDDSFCGRYDHLRPLLWQTPLVDVALFLARPVARLLGQQKALDQILWMRRELNTQPAPRSFLLDRLRPEDAVDTVEKEIYRLHIPTLVITGDRDETIPLWHSQTYASEIVGARLVVIPTADHALPQSYAIEMAEAMAPFLQEGWR